MLLTLQGTVLNNVEKIKNLGITITNDLKWNTSNMSAIFAQRLIGPLASLDVHVTWRHAHMMVKGQHTRDWYVQAWSMVVQFRTPKVYFFKMNSRRCRKGQLNL